MIEFDIATLSPCGTDSDTLMTVRWPVLPRKGEAITICGLLRRCDSSLAEDARASALAEEHEFVVEGVYYDVSKTKPDDVRIAVWVRPAHAPWDSSEWVDG